VPFGGTSSTAMTCSDAACGGQAAPRTLDSTPGTLLRGAERLMPARYASAPTAPTATSVRLTSKAKARARSPRRPPPRPTCCATPPNRPCRGPRPSPPSTTSSKHRPSRGRTAASSPAALARPACGCGRPAQGRADPSPGSHAWRRAVGRGSVPHRAGPATERVGHDQHYRERAPRRARAHRRRRQRPRARPGPRRGARRVAGSGRGAVSALPPVRFLAPPSEPDVRVPAHPALHRTCDGRWGCWVRQRRVPVEWWLVLFRCPSTARRCCDRGSDTASRAPRRATRASCPRGWSSGAPSTVA
jgi:hypothetical protein